MPRALKQVLAVTVFLVVASLLAAVVLLSRVEAPPPVIVLQKPYPLPFQLRDWIGRWIPRSSGWSWAFRLEDLVFGKRKVVTLSTEFLKLPDPSIQAISDLNLKIPELLNSGGLRVWLVQSNELRSLRAVLKQNATEMINHPRVTTADGMACSLFTGEAIVINGITNQVGVEAALFARVVPETIDLFADFQVTDAITNSFGVAARGVPAIVIQTNLNVAIRLQVPRGSGVFLLDPRANNNRECFGVIIDPP